MIRHGNKIIIICEFVHMDQSAVYTRTNLGPEARGAVVVSGAADMLSNNMYCFWTDKLRR